MLRIIADDYDQAQRVRVAKGEQIRAIVQGREQQDGTYLVAMGYFDRLHPVTEKVLDSAAEMMLKDILKGETDEPNRYMAWSYRRSWEMEREAFSVMGDELGEHPAWGWMGSVRGVGPTLGAKLLARLDIDRANNASSFWLYCGLGTVPGVKYRCEECGRTSVHPATFEITGKHKGCKAVAEKVAGPDDGIRAAQPRAERGQKRSYDAFAKKVCYLLATSWLKVGPKSFYNQIYRDKVAYYERERPGWEKGRRHFSALRVAEKLFLSHLYEAWCEALGREPGECYAAKHLGHDGIISAADVLAWEEEASKAA